MKKHIYLPALAFLLAAGFTACNTDSLADMDNPKYMVTDETADIGMLFTNLEVNYSRRSAVTALRIPAGYAKYYATHSLIMPGDRYQYDGSYFNEPWDMFSNEAKMVVHILSVLEKENSPQMANNIAILNILKGAIFSWGTDVYGDIPYSEAGEAYLEGMLSPVFDAQQDIYRSILETLSSSCAALDESLPSWRTYDVIYKGDISAWRQFGYSLMLRMAMRMAAADPESARRYAEEAIKGGVILDNAANFSIPCVDNQNSERNPVAYAMIYNDPEKYWKLGADFVEALKDSDPRRKVILGGKLREDLPVPNSGIMNTYWWDDTAWDYTVDLQRGYPHGQDVQFAPYERIQKDFTRPSRYLFDYESPVVRLAAHEMYFCIAKAAALGWNTSGMTADDMYRQGVRANMTFYNSYPGVNRITDAEIDDYLAYRPYSEASLLREMWIANYMDPFQGWFYIRQWGPDLAPNINGVDMPRRMPYASSEQTRNEANYLAALARMGMPADVTLVGQFTYRCWWDVRK
ncbi:MAG: SusD/RagB family nutrient-binding outer membrane lipoprotein [Tannerellaceae bacterium]|nr:SusD/RagB family nutrient-binding outer membrane lipoprotein [Tannerellaceae bacterium]